MIDGLGIEERLICHSAETLTQARHIVAFTGAAISAQSDTTQIASDQIPGRCKDHRPCIDLSDFAANPRKVWQYYTNRRSILKATCPTPSHYALAELENLLEDFLLITQNTDGLHQKAGSTKLIELYGNLWTARCTQCDYQSSTWEDFGDEPHCPACGHWLRPNVVWAGEPLPAEEFAAACEACENADLMITVGASAEVQPTASMIWQAKATGATLIEIHPTLTAASHFVDIRLATLPEKAIPALVTALKDLLVQHQI